MAYTLEFEVSWEAMGSIAELVKPFPTASLRTYE